MLVDVPLEAHQGCPGLAFRPVQAGGKHAKATLPVLHVDSRIQTCSAISSLFITTYDNTASNDAFEELNVRNWNPSLHDGYQRIRIHSSRAGKCK